LAVGVVEIGGEQHWNVAVVERLAGHRRRDQLRTTRVTRGANLDLTLRSPEIGEAVGHVALARPRAGPGDVPLAGAVTGLTAHVDLGPRGCIAVGARVVALPQVGRVARRAHRVPALIPPRPVEDVAGRRLLLGVEMEPPPCGDVPAD